jgi:hypothetical protein
VLALTADLEADLLTGANRIQVINTRKPGHG